MGESYREGREHLDLRATTFRPRVEVEVLSVGKPVGARLVSMIGREWTFDRSIGEPGERVDRRVRFLGIDRPFSFEVVGDGTVANASVDDKVIFALESAGQRFPRAYLMLGIAVLVTMLCWSVWSSAQPYVFLGPYPAERVWVGQLFLASESHSVDGVAIEETFVRTTFLPPFAFAAGNESFHLRSRSTNLLELFVDENLVMLHDPQNILFARDPGRHAEQDGSLLRRRIFNRERVIVWGALREGVIEVSGIAPGESDAAVIVGREERRADQLRRLFASRAFFFVGIGFFALALLRRRWARQRIRRWFVRD